MYDPDDPDVPDLLVVNPLHEAELYFDERRSQIALLTLRRRGLRDSSNPFNVTYEAFISSYRLSQDLCFCLIDMIRPYMKRPKNCLAVPLELKVLAVLSFFASGSYQTPTGKQFDCPVGQSTMSSFIKEFTGAMTEDAVVAHVIRFPRNEEEANICIRRNQNLGGKVPRTVGYTDGSLFNMKKPSVPNNRQAFIGRKGQPCINAQITCDRRLYIMNICARFPGATADSFIFAGSALRARMLTFCQDFAVHLLGDSGYAQEPWMMTPFPHPEEGSPEELYNILHCSDRNAVERCIGLLKGRFRCLIRVLYYDYPIVCRFIMTAVVLHNLCVLANIPFDEAAANLVNDNFNPEGPEGLDDEDDVDAPPERRQALAILAEGRRLRQEIADMLWREQ